MNIMSLEERKKFIAEDLAHELYCLLSSATIWEVYRAKRAGYEVVIAMDSAFIHARCLYFFFTKLTTKNDISITEFGPNPYKSELFTTWIGPLNMHVLHINQGRSTPTNIQNGQQLNEQVVMFAREILMLWDKLIVDSAACSFKKELIKARNEAVAGAEINTCNIIEPLFQ